MDALTAGKVSGSMAVPDSISERSTTTSEVSWRPSIGWVLYLVPDTRHERDEMEVHVPESRNHSK